jgi:spermidine/putrescine transport system ATP-binding protein
VEATVQPDGGLLSADGPLGAVDLGRHPAGSAVTVALRAEAVVVSATQPSGPALEATVAGISFLGDAIQYVVMTGSGVELIARAEPGRAEQLATGQRVWCSWDPGTPRVFESAAAGRAA